MKSNWFLKSMTTLFCKTIQIYSQALLLKYGYFIKNEAYNFKSF